MERYRITIEVALLDGAGYPDWCLPAVELNIEPGEKVEYFMIERLEEDTNAHE